MKSYNCFYSALYDVLEPHYTQATNLLINNRWQFFYNPNLDYSDDKRIVGEYPLPFDTIHIEYLHILCKIRIQIMKARNGIDELAEYIHKNGYVIVFVNKCSLLNSHNIYSNRRCVTTIIINKLNHNKVHFFAYDNNIPISEIDISSLDGAWIDASEYNFLNKSIVHVSINNKFFTYEKAVSFFWKNILYSINNYLNIKVVKNIFNGYSGIGVFATAICQWNKEPYQKILVDCSMYIEFIINQRECIKKALELVLGHCHYVNYDKTINTLDSIIEIWKKIKMFFYIVGKRGQYESVKFISDQIRVAGDLEYRCLTDILKIAEEYI